MKKKFVYGHKVGFYTVLSTERNVSVYLPMAYPWEMQSVRAVIYLGDGYKIVGNLGAKLLIASDDGIREKAVPFLRNGNDFRCVLPRYLEKLDIEYERENGIACDGSKWEQKDYTSEILYCQDGLLEHGHSPYWGGQYQLYFAKREIRPDVGGKLAQILRFNDCDPKDWPEMEKWFRYLVKKKRILDPPLLSQMVRDVNQEKAIVFMQRKKKEYDWKIINLSRTSNRHFIFHR